MQKAWWRYDDREGTYHATRQQRKRNDEPKNISAVCPPLAIEFLLSKQAIKELIVGIVEVT